jgi:hypothetical protein
MQSILEAKRLALENKPEEGEGEDEVKVPDTIPGMDIFKED